MGRGYNTLSETKVETFFLGEATTPMIRFLYDSKDEKQKKIQLRKIWFSFRYLPGWTHIDDESNEMVKFYRKKKKFTKLGHVLTKIVRHSCGDGFCNQFLL